MNELRALLNRVDEMGPYEEHAEWIENTTAVVVRPVREDDIITDIDHVGGIIERLAEEYNKLGCTVTYVEGGHGKRDKMVASIGGIKVWIMELIGNKRAAEKSEEEAAARKNELEKQFIPETVSFDWQEVRYRTKTKKVPADITTKAALEEWCEETMDKIVSKVNPNKIVQDECWEWPG